MQGGEGRGLLNLCSGGLGWRLRGEVAAAAMACGGGTGDGRRVWERRGVERDGEECSSAKQGKRAGRGRGEGASRPARHGVAVALRAADLNVRAGRRRRVARSRNVEEEPGVDLVEGATRGAARWRRRRRTTAPWTGRRENRGGRREKRDGVGGKMVNRWKFQILLCKLNVSQSFVLKHEKFQERKLFKI